MNNPYCDLARAILVRTLKDARHPNYKHHVRNFVFSRWFEDICVLAEVNDDYMRNKILKRL